MDKKPDIDAALLRSVDQLGRRGLYAKAISRATGLSLAQVSYRLKRLEVKLGDYRDGLTREAKQYIEVTPCARWNVKAQAGEKYKVIGIKVS